MSEIPSADVVTNKALKKSSKGRVWIGLLLTVGIFIVTFGIILPQFIDYGQVVDAFLRLQMWQFGILGILAVTTYVLQGLVLQSTMPGLAIGEATLGMLASLAVKGTIPGPMDLAVRFRLMVAYGHGSEPSALSAAMFKSLELLTRVLMPPIAAAILLVTGQSLSGIALLAILGTILSVVAIASFIALMRSDRLAERLGNWIERTSTSIATRLKRTPPGGLSERIVSLRAAGQELVGARGLVGVSLSLLVQGLNGVILTLALAFVGVDFDILPIPFVFAALALVYFLPLGPGLIELGYMSLFTLAVGTGNPELGPIMAGVLVFRVFQWLIPVPIGWGLIVYWQRHDHFSLMSGESAVEPDARAV
jgi:uncharacterized membrane protein YbhN (UPF0104 family)